MKILVVGGGGREHALAWKIAQSPRVSRIYCAPGNAGTISVAENIDIRAEDIEALLAFAKNEKINFTVVGPEQPLVAGIVDLFKKNGLKIFGPSMEASRLEGSKIFMKEVLISANIPTAEYHTFTSADEAIAYLNGVKKFPQVVKADGLAAGKGVLVAPDAASATAFVKDVMGERIFGDSGNRVIIEQFLGGEEASYIVVADGENFVPLATSQDHKRIGDNDTGPNTGGMGAYSPAPIVTDNVRKKVDERVIKPLLAEMKRRGSPFTGFLYAGLMIENGEPYVLEFNVRFGDPETQPILSRYPGDLLDLLEAAANGDVTGIDLEWPENASVCVVMAAGGYPGSYAKGKTIEGLEKNLDGVTVFHAGTGVKDEKVVTSGGRVLGVTATARTIKEAKDLAYSRVKGISWDGCYFRNDIADKAIKNP
ncbi:MAG: phosphoribosylamine--glycine ligase [Nitrospinota bacterium]|nr:phosphoribosylamine--glycine ligase [Nitrospinota bacterium]